MQQGASWTKYILADYTLYSINLTHANTEQIPRVEHEVFNYYINNIILFNNKKYNINNIIFNLHIYYIYRCKKVTDHRADILY